MKTAGEQYSCVCLLIFFRDI